MFAFSGSETRTEQNLEGGSGKANRTMKANENVPAGSNKQKFRDNLRYSQSNQVL